MSLAKLNKYLNKYSAAVIPAHAVIPAQSQKLWVPDMQPQPQQKTT
jgi:hypothetical protein